MVQQEHEFCEFFSEQHREDTFYAQSGKQDNHAHQLLVPHTVGKFA